MKVNKENLFPRKVEGGAQVPYVYDRDHSLLLNFITICNVIPENGIYEISDRALAQFKDAVRIQGDYAGDD